MRKTLWITLAVLLVAIGAPNAHADSYNSGAINFTAPGVFASNPPSGSFVYDNTTNEFASFDVHWLVPGQFSVAWDLASCANGLGGIGNIVCNNDGFSGPQATYLALISCNDATTSTCSWFSQIRDSDAFFDILSLGVTNVGGADPDLDIDTGGNFTVTVTSEPSTFVLMLLGIGFLLVLNGKRLARGLQLAI